VTDAQRRRAEELKERVKRRALEELQVEMGEEWVRQQTEQCRAEELAKRKELVRATVHDKLRGIGEQVVKLRSMRHLEGVPCPIDIDRGVSTRTLFEVTCISCLEIIADWSVGRSAELQNMGRVNACGHRVREKDGRWWECERAPGHYGRHGYVCQFRVRLHGDRDAVRMDLWHSHVGNWNVAREEDLDPDESVLRAQNTPWVVLGPVAK